MTFSLFYCRKIVFFTILFVLLFLLNACSEGERKSYADSDFIADAPFALPTSTLTTPILIEVADIEKRLNQEIKGDIINDDSFEKDGVKLRVSKIEPIKIHLKKNVLFYTVPLKVWVEKQVKKNIFKKEIKAEKDLSFSLRLQFKSEVEIDSDWKLQTKTKQIGLEWIEKPSLKIGFIKIGLAATIEKALNKKKEDLENKIDQVAQRLNVLEKVVGNIWKKLQDPILLDKKTNKVWLVNQPTKIEASKIGSIQSKEGNCLEIFVKIHTNIKTIISEKPAVSYVPLPALRLNKKLQNEGFALHVEGIVFYQTVNQILSEKVQDTVLKFPDYDYAVKIKKAAVSGQGKFLVFELGAEGDVNGNVFFRGRPLLDTATVQIKVQDFDFDVQTEETILQTAQWLMKESAKERVQEMLVFSLQSYTEKLPLLIKEGLSKGKISEQVEIDIQTFELYPQEMRLTTDALNLYAISKGKIAIKILKL
ncbi:DUF4403 family protein [Hugenholtzia roseola]|uniref:DUF4403 family protein n=1 Tax=Hugenholtzia roseola TaxID=1002 RepID=UPI00047BF705|nr:DUF4403 family protein [Hugenholtzia roseola]